MSSSKGELTNTIEMTHATGIAFTAGQRNQTIRKNRMMMGVEANMDNNPFVIYLNVTLIVYHIYSPGGVGGTSSMGSA